MSSRNPWVVAAAVVAILVVVVVLDLLDGNPASTTDGSSTSGSSTSAEDERRGDTFQTTCVDLADEAARISTGGSTLQARLLRLGDPVVLEDNTATAEVPAVGAEDELVLSCQGLGVYDDGTSVLTQVRMTVDSAGDLLVTSQPIG